MTSNQNLVAELQADVVNLKIMIANLEFALSHCEAVEAEEPDITKVMADQLEALADSVMVYAQSPYRTLQRNGLILTS